MVPAIRLHARQYRAMRWSEKTRPVWITGIAVFVLGIVIFGFALRHDNKLAISDQEAVRAALSDQGVRNDLALLPRPTRVDVIPLDRVNARVSLFHGQKAIAEVAVSPQ